LLLFFRFQSERNIFRLLKSDMFLFVRRRVIRIHIYVVSCLTSPHHRVGGLNPPYSIYGKAGSVYLRQLHHVVVVMSGVLWYNYLCIFVRFYGGIIDVEDENVLITDKNTYQKGIKRVLISEEELQEAVQKCAAYLDREYEGKPLILVSVLKGAFVFLSDLTKKVTIPCEVSFMAAKSYFEGTSSSGNLEITYDLDRDISDYHVVIVEDIIDTGRTLQKIVEILKQRNPLSLKIVTLLDKPERRIVDMEADYVCFAIPDHFVIGYGLDYGEYYRNLPYIAEFGE